MRKIGACHYCGAFVGIGAHQHREESKEPEVDSYTKSAEIAGKLLKHMEEAGCKLSTVTLYHDGSGHFRVYKEDEKVAYELLHLRLPEAHFYRHGADSRQGV
ncbi:hypothetical protein LCGC14_2466800, partial [marine sediment metagenome]